MQIIRVPLLWDWKTIKNELFIGDRSARGCGEQSSSKPGFINQQFSPANHFNF
jgi:hypothetical protein